MEYLLGLWKNNKILFFILLPLVVVAVAIKLYQQWILISAKNSINKATGRSKKMEKQKQAAIQKAKESEEYAKALAKAREDLENAEIGKNWHKDEE